MRNALLSYHNWPIKRKLSTIVILISGLLIGFMAIAVTIEKNYSYRSKLIKNSTVLAEIIGANSTAALTFRDQDTAYEILAALRAEQDLIGAALYDANGGLFTSYSNPAFHQISMAGAMPEKIAIPATLPDLAISPRYIDVIQSIALGDKAIGYIALRTDLTSFKAQLELFVILILCFSFILFSLGTFICSRLNRTIAGPVTTLAETMQAVMLTQNFDLRVKTTHEDEIGVLINGFNSMLAQIQKRDAEITRHQDRLEALVETRTSELKLANEQLLLEILEREEIQARLAHAEKMEAIGTLAGGVAHDLNNILSGIVSYPDLLLLDLDKNSPLRQPIETIRASGRKAAAIVQDLLTLARRGVKVAERVELRKLIGDYLVSPECLELRRNHPMVDIILPEYSKPFVTTGSPLHLSKTIMNLISNAAEAIPDSGKIIIELEEMVFEPPPVDFRQWREGPYIRITITDTGIGIAERYLDRIFEPFYSRKVMGRSGTGLGMAVVWGTVEDHKGYITVASTEGKGTTFQLFLPAGGDPPPTVEHRQLPDEQLRGKGQSILIVDDSPDQCRIATDILNHLCYSAASVASGEAAVEYLKQTSADLIILDMLMAPGIDGLETYKRILAFRPDQKAIIASGFSQPVHVEEARNLGVMEYVLKPYTVMRLSQAVQTALGNEAKHCLSVN